MSKKSPTERNAKNFSETVTKSHSSIRSAIGFSAAAAAGETSLADADVAAPRFMIHNETLWAVWSRGGPPTTYYRY